MLQCLVGAAGSQGVFWLSVSESTPSLSPSSYLTFARILADGCRLLPAATVSGLTIEARFIFLSTVSVTCFSDDDAFLVQSLPLLYAVQEIVKVVFF